MLPPAARPALRPRAQPLTRPRCAAQGGGDSQTATLDSLSKKLSDDLRQHIKSLGSYSLLSKEWVGTAVSPLRPQPRALLLRPAPALAEAHGCLGSAGARTRCGTSRTSR